MQVNDQVNSSALGAIVAVASPWEDFASKAILGIIVGVSVWLITIGIREIYKQLVKKL